MKDITIMYSGGLDSFIAYYYAKSKEYNPKLLYVNLHHTNAEQEIKAMKRNELEYTCLDFNIYDSIMSKLTNQIIPSRNLLFAVIGGMLTDRVWIGALDGEQNGKEHDKSEKFFKDTTELLTYTNNFFQEKTIVETPFANMSKKETITWAIENGVSKEQLLNTRSCYSLTNEPCGVCLTCVKRHIAFYLNGIDDGLKDKVINSEYFYELSKEIPVSYSQKDYSRFTPKRISEFFSYLKMLGDDNE